MTYFADPNHIEYDEWFDENIDPRNCWIIQMKFIHSVHEKFYRMSTLNLTIGSSNDFHQYNN